MTKLDPTISDRLRDSDGFTVFKASDGLPAIRADTQLLTDAANHVDELEALLGLLLKRNGWQLTEMGVTLTTGMVDHLIACAEHPDSD